MQNFSQIWPVLQINGMIVLEAIRGVRDHRFSYRDALVWATARLNQACIILSEDFSHEHVVEGVRFINPFLMGQAAFSQAHPGISHFIVEGQGKDPLSREY